MPLFLGKLKRKVVITERAEVEFEADDLGDAKANAQAAAEKAKPDWHETDATEADISDIEIENVEPLADGTESIT
jgi:hypothetical protein